MLLLLVVFLVPYVGAQELGTALSTVQTNPVPAPFADLFPGASSYIYDGVRKVYSDPGYSHTVCPTYKSDALSSLASVLGSAAKIMLAAAAIAFLKVMGGKLLLLPLTVILIAKMALKTLLLWPILSKLMKFLKKKKKKHARTLVDCTERVSCLMRRSVQSGWGSNLGSAVAFSIIQDVEDDSPITSIMLNILAGHKVAKCMDISCSEGVDIS